MQVHGYASSDVNGNAPPTDPDEQLEEEEEDEFAGSEFDYSQLFKAPSYSEFIKTPPNSRAKTYEVRVQSMMKAGLIGSINAQNWPDAATFLKHGPGFAKAAGNLAAEDARAAKIIEMLTAPDSPYIMFAMVALPFIAQLTRNHQDEVKEAASTWRERRAEKKEAKRAGVKPERSGRLITVRVFKREFKLPIRFRIKLPNLKNAFSAFLTPTQHPKQITAEVFNDMSVVKALHKMGVFPRQEGSGGDGSNQAA